MNPKLMKRALGDIESLGDSTLDGRIKAMASAKAVPEAEEVSQEESQENELTPDEVQRLKALLAQQTEV